MISACFAAIDLCDCMIVCGTSATVYPAAAFPQTVAERGGHVIEANPNPTPLSPVADVVLRGPTGVVLPQIVDRLR